jgi:hypothetical protein
MKSELFETIVNVNQDHSIIEVYSVYDDSSIVFEREINEENEFNEKLLLPPGTSIMKLEATDRFERKVEHTLWYTYNGSIPDIGTSSQIMIQPVATSSIEITE